MRIPLSFSADRSRITVESTIIYAGRAVFPVLFIVDTGSMDTFIDKGIISRARVSPPTEIYKHVRMGGTTISLSKLGKIEMVFENDANEREKLVFEEMKIANNAKQTSTYSGVSILGMDFLINKRARLVVDPFNNESHITINT